MHWPKCIVPRAQPTTTSSFSPILYSSDRGAPTVAAEPARCSATGWIRPPPSPLTYLHPLPSPSRPLSLSLCSILARARSPPKPRRRRGPDHRSSSRRVPELPLRRPRRPRASGRAGVPCSGRVKLFPNLGRRRPPRFIPPPLCAPVHSRASVCRAVSLRPSSFLWFLLIHRRWLAVPPSPLRHAASSASSLRSPRPSPSQAVASVELLEVRRAN